MQYVIVGNGVSAIGAIEGIRRHDSEGKILVVGEEELTTYGRPLISYFLSRKIGSDLALREDSYYEQMNVELRLGTRVDCLDTKKKAVITADGENIAYDKVLLAVGSSPFRPAIPGMEGPGIHSFTNWAHAAALDELVERAGRVVVIGGGLIALKAAEGLFDRGVDVTMVVRSRILRVYFDTTAARMVSAHLAAKGIKILQKTGTQAIARDEEGKVLGVDTDMGRLPADAVIVAAGVRPNTDMARCAGIDCKSGIVVDDYMQTSAADVYAAGDVAEAKDLLTGKSQVTPIWPNAYNQGVNAGINMTGAGKAYPGGLSMNAITFYGLPTISVGLVNPPEDPEFEVHAFLDEEREVYRKLVFYDGRLVGCMLVGEVDSAGVYTSFIQFKLPLDEESKAQLVEGTPSPLFWPEDFFDEKLKPGAV